MVTEADFAAATRLRLPTRYAFQNRDGVIDASCIGRASAVYPATVVAYRSRGPNFKRLKATTEDGAVYAIDLMVNRFDFTDLAPAGVLRGTDGEVIDGILEVSDARFREVEDSLAEGNRLRAEAHASWRGGINYVSELLAVEGHAARPGLRAPQIGALHAIAAHWSLSKDPAIIVMPTGTGKTEVMLAITVESHGDRILVIVPTDALRQQTADTNFSESKVRCRHVAGYSGTQAARRRSGSAQAASGSDARLPRRSASCPPRFAPAAPRPCA